MKKGTWKCPALLGNYGTDPVQPTDKPTTDRRTGGVIGKLQISYIYLMIRIKREILPLPGDIINIYRKII